MSSHGNNLMGKHHLHLSGRVALLLVSTFLVLALLVHLAGLSLTAYATEGTSTPAVLLAAFSFDTPSLADTSGHGREAGAAVTALHAPTQGLNGSGAMQFVASRKQFVTLSNYDGYFDRASFSSFVWMRTLNMTNASRAALVSKHYNWDVGGWDYRLWDKGSLATIVQGLGLSNTLIRGSQLADGQWHLVGVSYDASARRVLMYLDTQQVGNFATAVYEDAFLAPVILGTQRQWSQTFFDGYMDEFTFFDRVLTTEEVKAVYDRRYETFSRDATAAQPIITLTRPTDLLVSQSFITPINSTLFLDDTSYQHHVQLQDAIFVASGGVRNGGFVHFKDDAGASQEEIKDNGGSISNTRNLNPTSITYSWWMRFSAQEPNQTGVPPHIFDKLYSRASGTRVLLRKDLLEFSVGNDNIRFDATGPGVLRDSQWHHYVLTYDGDACQATFYVDGALHQRPLKVTVGQLFTDIIPCGLAPVTECRNTPILYRLQIGNRIGSNYAPLRGDFDEMKIWGRALSSSEVADVYSRDLNGQAPPSSSTTSSGEGSGSTSSGSSTSGSSSTPVVIPAPAPDTPAVSAPPGATAADLTAAKEELLRLQAEIENAQLEASYNQEQLQQLQVQQQQVQDTLAQLNTGDGIVYQEEQEAITVAPLGEAPPLAAEQEAAFASNAPALEDSAFSLPVVFGLVVGVLVIIGGTLFGLRWYHKRRLAAVTAPSKAERLLKGNGRR